jgi:formylglycine-generating enzyme required for sulfatase activity
VMIETGDRQIPWTSSTPVDRFYLAGGTTVITQPQTYNVGGLQIQTDPPGARIAINDKDWGTAPQVLNELSPGIYRVSAALTGYRTEEKTITVDSGRASMVTFYLDPAAPVKGRLNVSIDPADALVRILNIEQRYTEGMLLNAGQYEIQVSKQGYETKSEWITIEAGKSLDLRFKLEQYLTGKNFKNSLGMAFVYIPPGNFTMGSTPGAPGRSNDERQHHVMLTKGFYMQTTEVTQGQWKAVMGSNPSYFIGCGDDCPVENVSWRDALAFIQGLNQREGGRRYRLPTEAEWEYACRSGGREELYAGGSDIDQVAWYYPNSGHKTHDVGLKRPNGLGLYDMSGNVWEWCQDQYASYSSISVTDPVNVSSDNHHVLRGGSWSKFGVITSSSFRSTYDYNVFCRCGDRFKLFSEDRHKSVGLRLAAQ